MSTVEGVSEYQLANGLRVIIAPDRSAPVFSVAVNYNVGSRDERQGRTGFAHLFEHMMFKGSANVGAFEHPLLVFNNGGNMNGTTNKDRTLYYETLPANQLDLALFLEADRMRSLDISQANLDNQRQVVEEEKRQSYDNQPYGGVREAIQQMAYTSFGYRHTTIGSMDDLNAATLEDVRGFYENLWGVPLDPKRGLTVVEVMNAIHDGVVRGMYVMGENPAMSDPDVEHARQALAKL